MKRVDYPNHTKSGFSRQQLSLALISTVRPLAPRNEGKRSGKKDFRTAALVVVETPGVRQCGCVDNSLRLPSHSLLRGPQNRAHTHLSCSSERRAETSPQRRTTVERECLRCATLNSWWFSSAVTSCCRLDLEFFVTKAPPAAGK